MNYTQKNALYGLYLTGFLLMIPLVDWVDTKIPFYIWQPIILIGVILLVLPIYRINKCKDKTFDELDKKICIRSALIAFVSLFVIGIAGYILILFWFESFTLSIDHLPILVYGALSVFLLLFSTGVLFQYVHFGKERKGL